MTQDTTQDRDARNGVEPTGFTPRLVALDIDGTLVDGNGVMPDDVREAVGRIVAAGVPVVLATGRGWTSTDIIFEHLQLPPGWAVTANGAMVVRYPPLEVVSEERFDPADSIAKVSQAAPEAIIGVQEGLKWRVSRPFPDGELHGEVVIESLEELASRPVSRIVIRDPDSSEAVFNQMARSLGLHEVTYFIGWSAWLDIAPRGIDKAHGLQQVVDALGLTAGDVLALGDGDNDIEMLQWAGRGVAMGGTAEDVRAAADHVTGTFEDGGTAEEIGRWF
ncbi:HAD family hydrolase [Tessaracoccus antarcticus]|uniref:HAD family phosphatase n=1 Tax=Tessaracoccus antarcticus TaxID=2479848 RepID=A0A3M0GV95_9ACTN|nr:HAD family hydrolase [Tessaracoccus antarcticus]RMB61246.1 HAD family phosphatase [Tessaracoccus antarcticus]